MTGTSDDARTAAYAELVSSLVGARHDAVSARFDEELAAAEAAGTLDPATARTLRWWQRESVRAVEEHLASVLPPLLTGLEASEREAVATVDASAASWALASGNPGPSPDDGPGGLGGGRPGPDGPPSPPPGPGTGGRPGASPAPYLRPVDTSTPSPPRPTPLHPGFAPPSDSLLGTERAAHESVAGGAPPRRLLVAGLTVLTDEHDRSTTRTTRGHAPGASG